MHDNPISSASKFFSGIITGNQGEHLKQNYKEEIIKLNDINVKKTYIYVPHPEYFFDILTWIYAKDSRRLSLAADEPESFLCILNLGIFLEMCGEFFKTLLEHCEIKLDEDLLQHSLWSRFSFTFEVLTNLINLMPKENHFLKINALLSWLKEDNSQKPSETNDTIKEREFELLTSKDYFQVKNFISDQKLMQQINVNELLILKNKFPNLLPALSTEYLIEKFVAKPAIKISCRVCKKVSNNIQDFANKQCELKLYHPRNLVQLQRQLSSTCEHENCKRKLMINEFPCCHKGAHVEGCMYNDGKHIMQFDTIKDN